MREERAVRRDLQGRANLSSHDGQTSGRKVIAVKELSYSWDKLPIISNFSTTVWRGDKIGVVGLNGSGKSTLLQLLLKQLEPQSGRVEHGTKLEIAYFDQLKGQVRGRLVGRGECGTEWRFCGTERGTKAHSLVPAGLSLFT